MIDCICMAEERKGYTQLNWRVGRSQDTVAQRGMRGAYRRVSLE